MFGDCRYSKVTVLHYYCSSGVMMVAHQYIWSVGVQWRVRIADGPLAARAVGEKWSHQ